MKKTSLLLAFLLSAAACSRQQVAASGPDVGRADRIVACTGDAATPTFADIIPAPSQVQPASGHFELVADAALYVDPATPELMAIADYLAAKLRPTTGFALPVRAVTDPPPAGNIYMTTRAADPALGEEGYALEVSQGRVTLTAPAAAGLFHGIQTVRQLLPPAIDRAAVQPGPWLIAAGSIRDQPRFRWRGAMLDVVRHFFPVADLERYMDLLAYYKINRFHIHIADDQGFRVAISSWPRLTSVGAQSELGGGPGGFYTKAQYQELVAYASARYITIVPEIDMPGHSGAALASYAQLNCNGVAPPLLTGGDLCVSLPATAQYVHDVLGELAAMTPGEFLHRGGDESNVTGNDYVTFGDQVQSVIRQAGKRMIGWSDIGVTDLDASSLAQHWATVAPTLAAKSKGAKIVMSPANHAYMDMKYDAQTPLGLDWAGFVPEPVAYSWDPAQQVDGVGEADIEGVEGPLWSETLVTMADIEFMAFPRMPGIAEIGWSPVGHRSWDEYKVSLAAHGPRLTALGVNYYVSDRVPWVRCSD
jgi:hexosaminidase